METIYSLSDQVDYGKLALKTDFNERLAQFAKEQSYEARLLTCNAKPLPLNTGGVEIQNNGSVIDICQMGTFYQMNGINTLGMEISYMRYSMLPFFQPDWSFTIGHMPYSLFYDYLLSSSVCLVEIFDKSGRVDKFFGTRSAILASALSGDEWGDKIATFEKGVEMTKGHYEQGYFRMLKITPSKEKEKFKVTVPRKVVDLSGIVKVTPLYFMLEMLEGFQEVLDSGMLHIKYVKDNLTVRTIDTTTDTRIMHKHYPPDYVKQVFQGRTLDLTRGYMRIPELGLSKYDKSGVRALNLSRIVEITRITEFDDSFINVDFDSIMPRLRDGITAINKPELLKQVYYDLVGREPADVDFYTLRVTLLNHIDVQYRVGTTMAQKAFHRYMMKRRDVYPKYTGEKVEAVRLNMNFNMGFK